MQTFLKSSFTRHSQMTSFIRSCRSLGVLERQVFVFNNF